LSLHRELVDFYSWLLTLTILKLIWLKCSFIIFITVEKIEKIRKYQLLRIQFKNHFLKAALAFLALISANLFEK
jgi:hypothetical protein